MKYAIPILLVLTLLPSAFASYSPQIMIGDDETKIFLGQTGTGGGSVTNNYYTTGGYNTTQDILNIIYLYVYNNTFIPWSSKIPWGNITGEPDFQTGTELTNSTNDVRVAINGSDINLNYLDITGSLKIANYIDLVETLRPGTPSTNHSYLYVESISDYPILSWIDENGHIIKIPGLYPVYNVREIGRASCRERV
jgi:hypothetical protein